MSNARFAYHDGKRRWRVVPEDVRNLLQIRCGVIDIARIQLYLKRTPRTIVKLDDGINLPAFVILVMEKLGIKGFRIYLKISNHKRFEKKTERPQIP